MASITLQPGRSELMRLINMARSANRTVNPAPSLAGKTAIITGATSGFGLAAAHLFATLGISNLILGVRSVERGEVAASSIRKANPGIEVGVWELDMLNYRSVQSFAIRCKSLARVDMAILNAGIYSVEFARATATGHEEVLQVNYLSTALLAILLLPTLREKHPQDSPGRLTIVGSSLGLTAKFPERNAVPLLPALDAEWAGMAAASERYAMSKTLIFMLVLKLSQLVSEDHVILNVVEPGFSQSTNFGSGVSGPLKLVLRVLHILIGRTPEQAAWTYVDATATRGKETHGCFLNNWEIYP
jgi:NAD(P)-dependent dehydrogenase (short-subunit alcohol dehydrogenase family)